jgi:hypothetical protein
MLKVLAVVWVLTVALVVVPEVVVTSFVDVVDCDVAFAMAGSGCEGRGWGVSRNAVA